MAYREEQQLEHVPDELAAQRRKKELTPTGRGLLEEIERMAGSSEEILARVSALPPSDQAELVSILGEKVARGEEGHKRGADLARGAAETVREAEERELAAGRPLNPHMTLREALEILGR
jgi:hypothetical protein